MREGEVNLTDDKSAEVRVSESAIEDGALREQVTQLRAQVCELSSALKQANDIIENNLRARLTQKIQTISSYTDESLSKMSLDELKSIEKVLSMSRAQFKSIRPAIGVASDASNLTVPNLYGKTDEEIRKLKAGEP